MRRLVICLLLLVLVDTAFQSQLPRLHQQQGKEGEKTSQGWVPPVPILVYHSIGTGVSYMDIPIDLFTEQMDFLVSQGYKTIGLDDLWGGRVPAKAVIITFDDGYISVFDSAYPVMKERGLKGTLFVPTDYVGKGNYMGWDQLRDMMDSGFSIESHTASHAKLNQIRDEMDLLMELVLSREAIQKNLGYRSRYLAYPYGDKNNAVERAAQLAGYTSAVTVSPGYAHNQQNPYNLPRMAIWAREGMQGFMANLGAVAIPTAKMGERRQVPPPRWQE